MPSPHVSQGRRKGSSPEYQRRKFLASRLQQRLPWSLGRMGFSHGIPWRRSDKALQQIAAERTTVAPFDRLLIANTTLKYPV